MGIAKKDQDITTKKVFDYISSQKANGWTPTINDIGVKFGFSSSSARYHVQKLERNGYITIGRSENGNALPRTINIIKEWDR